MIYTSLAFLALTALVLWSHMGERARAKGAAAPAQPTGRTEPSPVEPVLSDPVPTTVRAMVREDICAGCATCVVVCPEDGAITMNLKTAVVNEALCVGHSDCAEACPTGAILLKAGATVVHRVVVPSVDVNYETSVPGLYIVGDFGGSGPIKNAINEGVVAVEAAKRSLAAEAAHVDASHAVDIAILGSGLAALGAGLEALGAGLTYVILEQGSLAEALKDYAPHDILFSEPLRLPVYGEFTMTDGSTAALLSACQRIVARTGLEVQTDRRVEQVARAGWLFRINAGGMEYLARRVVLALAPLVTPRRLDVRGGELDKVYYDVVELSDFSGRHVLVVGGGDGAVGMALGLANQPDTTVTLSYRKNGFARVKEGNRARIEHAVDTGRVALLFKSTVREIRRDVVVLDVDGVAQILPNDDVIVRIGGEPPSAFLEKLGVHLVQKEIPFEPDVGRAG